MVLKNEHLKRQIFEEHLANFIWEMSYNIFNTEGNVNSRSEIMCYMYYFVCKNTYTNTCWGDDSTSESVKENNLINLSKSIAKDMIDYYLTNNIPGGGALSPQNEDESRVLAFLTDLQERIL
jgi:hypothetical protein